MHRLGGVVDKRVIAVHISGQEYRVRTDSDEGSLQRVAAHVDAAMSRIRARTGTVDTLDVAVLTCLNLARDLLAFRERAKDGDAAAPDETVLRELIELAESALIRDGSGGDRAPLLTVPAGDELDSVDAEVLGSLGDQPSGDSSAPTP